MVTDLVTTELHLELPVEAGEVRADPAAGICKIAAIDRTHRPGTRFTGLIKGYGLRSGAVACSAAWDCSNIVVIGVDDGDMAGAVNRLAAMHGGAVLYEHGGPVAEVPMPIFGIASDLPMRALAARMGELQKALNARGVAFPDPLLSLVTQTGAAIPYLRISEEGLVNLKDGRTLGLWVDAP
jgi:adenine deaminase